MFHKSLLLNDTPNTNSLLVSREQVNQSTNKPPTTVQPEYDTSSSKREKVQSLTNGSKARIESSD